MLTRRVLLIESLLADSEAWEDASDSLQTEAIAMLSAVAEDFRSLPETELTLLLSPRSRCTLRETGRVGDDVRVEETTSGPGEWLDQNGDKAATFEAIMLIAPECDGVLVSLLQQIQCDPWNRVRRLNLGTPAAATFADKRLTADWLRKHGITTPDTRAISSHRAAEFLHRRTRIKEYCVLKPRHGAGSDRVNVISMGQDEFVRLREYQNETDAEWVLQPLVHGDACSVGLIGGGDDRPAMILPGVRQDVQCHHDQFRYFGGSLPIEAPLAAAAKHVAEQIAAAVGAFSGYVGIDMVVTTAADGKTTAHLIEINPRLCTSYVGYRALCEDNLAAVLLQQSSDEIIRWKETVVTFNSQGVITS